SIGSQVAALDLNGDGRSEFAVAQLTSSGDVDVVVYNSSGTQIASYTAANGASAFGIGKVDTNQDGNNELMVGALPIGGGASPGGNQVNVLNPITGIKASGFDVFAVLVGGISLDGQ